ncbi:Wzz/FepE/Etk N-terminal domain-containing protein [uncultured Thioclava sp.]|uniref:GumC family protein n=1 Tax=Thioclava arctica TaxID=3238301 RepID=A0ABV3TGA2_9RHOB|nr:Wzz/FepE/Etk N-terminal domain-containing protein [uncultured Thioclava sp.]
MQGARFYLNMLLRRIHWLILLTLLGTAAGLLVARSINPIYEADALLVVEGDSIPDKLATSTVQTDTNAKLQVIRKRVMSRESLLDIAKRMNLYSNLRLDSGARDADAVFAALSNSIKIEITGQTKDRRAPEQATFLTIAYLSGRPAQAAQVANELVTRVLKEDSDIRTKSARDTLDFFTREADRLSGELSKSSSAILKFKQENGEALPERLNIMRDQATELQSERAKITAQKTALEDQRDKLIRRHELSGDKVNLDAIYPPQLRNLAQLSAQQLALQAVLAQDDPKLAALGAQIASLRSKGLPAMPKNGDAFDARLRELEDDIFTADAQMQANRELYSRIQSDILRVPANAATLDALQLDHDNLRDQYDKAISARAMATTGDTIESLSKGERLTVINQAVAPSAPVKPNRKTIMLAGFGAGFVLGLLVIVAFELLNPGIRRPEDLTSKLGITAFATLPYVSTAADKALKRRRLVLSSGAVGLALIAVVVLVGVLYKPLDLVF